VEREVSLWIREAIAMEGRMAMMIFVSVVIGFIGLGAILFFRQTKPKKDENKMKKDNEEDFVTIPKKEKGTEKKSSIKISKLITGSNKNKFTHAVNQKDHPLFYKEIGGHVTSSCCVTFSSKHNLVASASKDGMIRCLPFSDVGAASPLEIFTKIGDLPSALSFTQNAKRLIVAVKGTIKFYSLIATETERKFELAKNLETGMKSITSVQLMDVEQWMVVIACGTDEKNEPCVRAFDRQGHRLANFVQIPRKGRVDKTRLSLSPKALAVASPDDRFLAVYGVAEEEGVKDGEVGVFEIIRDKITGHATHLRLAIVFSGHSSHVCSFGWNSVGRPCPLLIFPLVFLTFFTLGKQFITCCENGHWRTWDATVRYSEYELPRLYSSHQCLPGGILPSHVGLMKDGCMVVLVAGSDIYFCASGNGEVLQHISDATVSTINAIAISPDGQYLATVVDSVKRIAVWAAP
jgi:WD40 repeat protein